MDLNTFVEKRLCLYRNSFKGVPPTHTQLEQAVYTVSAKIFKLQVIAIAVCIASLIIAYKMMFKDYNDAFEVFNPACAIPLLVGMVYMLWTKRVTDKYAVFRRHFMPSENSDLKSSDAMVNQYVNEVKMQGRKYLTTYEYERLFVTDFSIEP